jgi:hypothetical protein
MAKPNTVDHITEDNVLLYEKQNIVQNEVIKQGDDRTFVASGFKIFRVVRPTKDGGFRELCQYDYEKDCIDLSKLHNYQGWYMASVDIDAYNKEDFVWNCIRIDEGSEDSQVFSISENRKCTDEEVEILNRLFPEYFDHAFKSH